MKADTRGDPLSQSRSRSLPLGVAEAIAAGKTLGRYAILSELGRGGMGVVLRGYDPELRRAVAIKQLLPRAGEDPAFTERRLRRFQLEGRAAAKLRHPGIVGVLEVGESEGQPFLVMDYVEGQPLDEVLDARRLTPREICELVRDAADALGHAHAEGIVHRDVKPANILVDAEGRARLTDFGLARDMDLVGGSSLSQDGQILGTPHFLSPEQAAGKPELTSPASDVFALGGVLYLALTGELPFDGQSLIELIRKVVDADPVRPREISPQINRDLETVILKCLAKEPARRYPEGGAVARELDRFLAGEAIEARPLGGRERLWRFVRRNKALSAVICASVSLLVIGGLYSVLRIRAERDSAEIRRLVAEAASAEAVAAREQAVAEGARARAAEAAAQANAERVEREVLVSRLQIARALSEKGQRLADLGFYNEAAALFAESLLRREDSLTRGQLARALIGLHPAAYDPPATRTAILPLGKGNYLVGSTGGSVRGEGAPTFPTCSASVRSLARLRDTVVAGLADGSVVSRDLNGQGPWQLGHSGSSPLIALAANPAGDRLAAVWGDGSLRVTSDLVRWSEVLGPQAPSPTALAWGAPGLVLGDLEGRLRFFQGSDLVEGAAREDVHLSGVAALAWVGSHLASLGYEGSLVRSVPGDPTPLERAARVLIPRASLALTAISEDEVAVGLLTGSIEHRRLSDFHPLREVVLGDVPVRCLAADESHYYAGGQGVSSSFDLLKGRATGVITGEAIYRIPGPGQGDALEIGAKGSVTWRRKGVLRKWAMPEFPTTLARDPGGLFAASGDTHGNVVLESSTKGISRKFAAHPGRPILSLRFARGGRHLLTACADELVIWDTKTGEVAHRRPFPGRALVEASISDDGKYGVRFSDSTLLLAGGGEPEYTVKDVVGGPCFAPVNPRDPKSRSTVWVAVGEGITQVIGRKLLFPAVLTDHAAPVRSLRVSHDGKYLLYARRDGVASLYRTFGTQLLARFPISRSTAWPPELDSQSMLMSATSATGAAGLWTIAPNAPGTPYYSGRPYSRLLGVGPDRFVAIGAGRKIYEHRLDSAPPLRTMMTPAQPVLLAHARERGVLAACGSGFLAEFSLRNPSAQGSVYQLPDLKGPISLAYWPPLEAWMIAAASDPELLLVSLQGKWRKQPANEDGNSPAYLGVSKRGFATGSPGRLDLIRGPSADPSLPEHQSWTFGDRRLVTGAAFGEGPEGYCLTSMVLGHRAGPTTLDSLQGELWFLGKGVTQRRLTHPAAALSLVRSERLLAWIGGRDLFLYDLEAQALLAVIPTILPELAGTTGLVFLDGGRRLVSLYETRFKLRAWNLAELGLFDTAQEAVERVARLTRLRVAGLDAVNQPDPGELVLARRLAAR